MASYLRSFLAEMESGDFPCGSAKRMAFVILATGLVRPVLPHAPLCSSRNAPWSDLLLEEYRSPRNVEHRDVAPAQHHLLLHLDEPTWMELRLEGGWRRFEVHRGHFFLCPAQIPMSFRCQDPGHFLCLSLDPARVRCAGLEWGPRGARPHLSPRLPFTDPFLAALVECLRAEIRAGYPGGRVYGESLATALIAHLLRGEPGSAPEVNGGPRGLSRPQLRRLEAFIREHLTEDISLKTLAGVAGLSPFHFVRVFKQTTGRTPHRYLLERRLERARELLLRRAPTLAEVAVEAGFCDQSHFTLHFKRAYGLTPGEFRRRLGAG